MAVNSSYIYWTTANGGTATTIARAKLNGTDVDPNFITGASNPCGIALSAKYIYWAGDGGNWIGRANINGTGANPDFISTGGAPEIAINSKYIYWTNYLKGAIGRASLNGTGVDDNFITGLLTGNVDIAVDSSHI